MCCDKLQRGERNTLQTVRKVRCPVEGDRRGKRKGLGASGADSEHQWYWALGDTTEWETPQRLRFAASEGPDVLPTTSSPSKAVSNRHLLSTAEIQGNMELR